MSKIFLVKSYLNINDNTMESMIVIRGKTFLDIKSLIKEGIDDIFGDRQEHEFIDSFFTQKDDVSIDNFHIQEISELEAVALEKFIGNDVFGYGLLSHIYFE